jgi:hypothetical protein
MRTPAIFALATTLLLAACGGGGGGGTTGGGTMPTSGGSTQSTQTASQAAVDAANALGDPVKAEAAFIATTSGSAAVARVAMGANRMLANGVCTNGIEFFAPDKNGDANSTEDQYFYDNACTQLARDVVRIYTINGSSETVTRNETQYAVNNATPIATRTATLSFVNGTYGANGYPVVADGFARTATAQTTISNVKTIADDNELVMQPGSNGVNTWCGDSAGYNETGIASLNETFGWQGSVLSGGTRTVNADGSVTWQATHTGSVESGAIGAIAIAAGTPNTACPITTPAYTLTGGTADGTYTIPVTTTFMHGELTALTVTNASLANGNTLNVSTNNGVSPTNANFITGSVTNGSSQLATFAVDCFGNGTLTVTGTGAQFVINDWHVVK